MKTLNYNYRKNIVAIALIYLPLLVLFGCNNDLAETETKVLDTSENEDRYTDTLTLEPLEGREVKAEWNRIPNLLLFKEYRLSVYKTTAGKSTAKVILIDSEEVVEKTLTLEERGVEYTIELVTADQNDKTTDPVSLLFTLYREVPSVRNFREVSKTDTEAVVEWEFTSEPSTGFTKYFVSFYKKDTPLEKRGIMIEDISSQSVMLSELESGLYEVKIWAVGQEKTVPSPPAVMELDI